LILGYQGVRKSMSDQAKKRLNPKEQNP